jgi:hypothetical protein
VEPPAAPDASEPLATPHGFDPAARATLLVVMAYQGLTLPLLGVAAPWISPRFGLGASELAKVYAIMSFSALVTSGPRAWPIGPAAAGRSRSVSS